MEQDEIEHVERTDRPDARDQGRLAVAVERLQGKTAAIDLAAFAHEFGQLIVEVLMPGESLVADFRKAALHAERHAGPVEQDEVSKPLRCSRVAWSMLTRPIEPSNATV